MIKESLPVLDIDNGSDKTDGQRTAEEFLRLISSAQNEWDFFIYRAAKSAADIRTLRNSTKTSIALFYLHSKVN